MVDFPINTGLRPIGDQVFLFDASIPEVKWFVEDITIKLSSFNRIASVVVDFAFSVSSIVEYTLDSGVNWIAFNNGDAVTGGQSRFIEVTKDVEVNFRATLGGTLIRCIVSSVP